jgi:hypothetical protein
MGFCGQVIDLSRCGKMAMLHCRNGAFQCPLPYNLTRI